MVGTRRIDRGTAPALLALAAMLALSMLTAAAPPAGAAGTVTVTAGESIQEAIDAATAGSVIEVGPGVYVENLDFGGKDLVVRSTDGPAVTTIDGAGADTVVTFVGTETRAAVIEGFTITNGANTSRAGGVYVNGASPTIRGNVITGNEGCTGSGLNVRFSGALIEHNQITHNSSRPGWSGCRGGGIAVGGAGTVELIANVIEANSADSGGGGVQLNAAGTPTVERNIIRANSSRYGAGVEIFNGTGVAFEQNLVVGNTAAVRGGAIDWLVSSSAPASVLVNNTIADNTAPAAAGVHMDGWATQVTLAANIISGPGAAFTCGGLSPATPPSFVDNTLWSTTGAAFSGDCADPTGSDGNEVSSPGFDAGDYTLAAGSPAIDTADTSAMVGPLDLAGNPRTVDGDGDGVASIDRGAYERATAPVTAPSAPEDLSVTRSRKNRADVAWWPPADDGGSPVTGYTVTVVETGAVVQTTGTRVTLEGLSTRTSFTITVVAANIAGTSPPAVATLEASGGKCNKHGC